MAKKQDRAENEIEGETTAKRARAGPTEREASAFPHLFTAEHRQTLEEKGYVVVPGIVDEKDCKEWRDELLQYCNSGPAEGKLSWENQDVEWLGKHNPTGTIHHINRTAAHLPCLWKARQHPAVAQIWADLYGCAVEDLAVSMDAWNIAPRVPPSKSNKKTVPKLKIWAHTDKDPSPCPFDCVQGQVVLFDCTDADKDGGLVVWQGSHKAHTEYFKQHPGHGASHNWYKFPPSYLEEIEVDGSRYLAPAPVAAGSVPVGKERAPKTPMPRVNVTARAGDVILWKSKTTHQSRPPSAGGQPRAVIYVCYAPKQYLRGEKEVQKRRKAFDERRMTSHWPCHDVRIFGKPRIWGPVDGEIYRKYWAANPLNHQSLVDVFTPLGRSLLCIGEQSKESTWLLSPPPPQSTVESVVDDTNVVAG